MQKMIEVPDPSPPPVEIPPVPKSSLLSGEFWAALAVIATTIAAVFHASPDAQATLGAQITQIGAAMAILLPSAVVVFQLIRSRTQLKIAHLDASAASQSPAAAKMLTPPAVEVIGDKAQVASPATST